MDGAGGGRRVGEGFSVLSSHIEISNEYIHMFFCFLFQYLDFLRNDIRFQCLLRIFPRLRKIQLTYIKNLKKRSKRSVDVLLNMCNVH